MERPSVGKALQAKLTESVSELIDKRTGELMSEVKALRKELQETRDQLAEAILYLEVRHRRDMFFAGEVRAARESEQFIAEHLVRADPFPNPVETLRHAVTLVTLDGPVVKIGVGDGTSLLQLAERLPGREIAGFDTLKGLSEDWRPGYSTGMLAHPEVPKVRGTTVIPGEYEQTVPAYLAEHPGPLALVYLDSKTYGAATTAFELIGDRLAPGTVLILGEYLNYPGWRDGEFKAWAEFVERSGIEFRYDAYTFDNDQVVVTVTATAGTG